MICRLETVSFRYAGHTADAVRNVTLGVSEGEHVALVGPNGAGKSTLLRLVTGVLEPRAGHVEVLGRRAGDWKRRELARQLAVVSQESEPDTGISVRELVSMGRHPYVRPWSALGRSDRRVVDSCLSAVDLGELGGRDVGELSGGELQRARLARALAQEPRLLLLDEPTAHLDMGHEMRFLELVAEHTGAQSLTVVSVTHHLNTAARFADRMILLSGGQIVATGPPSEILSPQRLESVFGWPVEIWDLGSLGRHAIPKRREPEEAAR